MARAKTTDGEQLADCKKCPRWKEVKSKVRVALALDKAISAMDKRIKDGSYKPSVAEYLKLLQLEQEFEQDEVKEIKVTWVEPMPARESET